VSVRETKLSNGLRVATDTMAGVETTSVGVWVDAGARNEGMEINGVSHMLEHMAFKGTKRRTARGIAEEIEAVGGHLNAYTSREQTAYFARVVADDLPLAVDMLADILQHSTFEDQELERERAVIVQEIGQMQDTPDDLVFDQLQEMAFPDQSLGRSILGTVERVNGFSRDTLRSYMDVHYRASGMVVVASGKVDHDEFVALVQKGFGDLGSGQETSWEAGHYTGGDWREERELEQVHLTLGFQGLPFRDDDFYAVQILSTALGGGMSSRLFQEVREVRGLAYSVFSFASSYLDCGLFGVYAGTGEGEVKELVPVVCDQLLEITKGIDADELSRAKIQHKAGMKMALESSMSRCEQLGRQILIYGGAIPIPEIIEKIDAVDIDAVSRVANRIVTSGAPTVAAIGPIGNLESYSAIAARFG
jgi:predicted Zn-dependent peptidase